MKRLAGLALLTLGLAAGPAFASDPPPTADPLNTRYLLMNQRGKAVNDQDYLGQFQLITFGYTHCPDVCPTSLAAMANILKTLGDRASHVQPIFITVDPARDTPARLAEYTAFFDRRIVGLTGPQAFVDKALEHYRVTVAKVREPGAPADQYSLDHSAGLYLVGPAGEFVTRFGYSVPTDEVARRLAAYIDEAFPPAGSKDTAPAEQPAARP